MGRLIHIVGDRALTGVVSCFMYSERDAQEVSHPFFVVKNAEDRSDMG